MKNLFRIGQLVATVKISENMYQSGQFSAFCQNCIAQHKAGNWGDLEEEDIESNNEALISNGRLLSCYLIPKFLNISIDEKIWIITEADRSSTTILFPSEY